MSARFYSSMSAIVALMVAAVVAAPAQASLSFTLGSISVDSHSADPGLVVQTTSLAPLSFDLNVGESIQVSLFQISTNETNVEDGEDTVEYPISVAFNFSTPLFSGGNVTGVTAGALGFLGFNQWGYVEWDGALDLGFGDGGLLQVSLSDATFNSGSFWGLGKQGATVKATFKLVSEPNESGVVPEPGTIFVWGLLAATAYVGTKKWRQVA